MEQQVSVTDDMIEQHNTETEDAFGAGTFAWYIPEGAISAHDIQLVCVTAMTANDQESVHCVRVSGNPAIDLPRKRLKGNVMHRTRDSASGRITVDMQRAS